MPADRMTVEDAARHLGVSVRTVRTYVNRGLLSTTRAPGSCRVWFSPADVEELRKDLVTGESPLVVKQELLQLRAEVRQLRSEMSVVLRVLDMQDAPLRLTPEKARDLHDAAVRELSSTAWGAEEVLQWAEVLSRLQEEDLVVVHAAVQSTPWVPFLRLCVTLITYVTTHSSYDHSIDLQMLHRRLTEARRRLRVSAICYSEVYGVAAPGERREIDRAALLDSPGSTREVLLRRARRASPSPS